jgi:RNA polymerase subunit RPABC4/transcription elongation factor Spt4
MTEKPEKKPSEEIKEILSKVLSQVETLSKNQTNLTHEAAGHKNIEDALDSCPHCKAKALAKLAPDIEKAIREKNKSIKEPVVCVGCGEIVERNERNCPNCHGTKAEPVGRAEA